MGKHTLDIEYDYDFVLIGISSHEKDYRICWALNSKLNIDLNKKDSLEIKDKKVKTPSFFSFYNFKIEDEFVEYSVIANFSENKSLALSGNNLFNDPDLANDNSENGLLIPEHKHLNYFFVVRAELKEKEIKDLIKKIKEIDIVQTAVKIEVRTLRSKQNLIF